MHGEYAFCDAKLCGFDLEDDVPVVEPRSTAQAELREYPHRLCVIVSFASRPPWARLFEAGKSWEKKGRDRAVMAMNSHVSVFFQPCSSPTCPSLFSL
jgi:hypothetical protein